MSGSLRDVLVGVLSPKPELDVKFLGIACAKLSGIDGILATEILIQATNAERSQILTGFNAAFKPSSFESVISQNMSGSMRDLLLSLSRTQRDESQATNEAKAVDDAKALCVVHS